MGMIATTKSEKAGQYQCNRDHGIPTAGDSGDEDRNQRNRDDGEFTRENAVQKDTIQPASIIP
jgi:hypothetical protein